MVRDNLPSFVVVARTCYTGDVGFDVLRRTRTYMVAYRTNTCTIHHDWRDLYDRVAKETSLIKTKPQDALVALPQALNRECIDARGKSTSRIAFQGRNDFFSLLTQDERRRLSEYAQLREERFYGPVQESDVFCLGENPHARARWSCATGSIPTLTKGWKRMWFPKRGRLFDLVFLRGLRLLSKLHLGPKCFK